MEPWILDLENDLKSHEGFRLKLYDDRTGEPPAKTWQGKLTIGYGWNIEDTGISEDFALFKLRKDISHLILRLESQWLWWSQLSGNRKRALSNLAYNMGLSGLLGFRNALRAMAEGRYRDAAKEFLDSKWARNDVSSKRANEIARLISGG